MKNTSMLINGMRKLNFREDKYSDVCLNGERAVGASKNFENIRKGDKKGWIEYDYYDNSLFYNYCCSVSPDDYTFNTVKSPEFKSEKPFTYHRYYQ